MAKTSKKVRNVDVKKAVAIDKEAPAETVAAAPVAAPPVVGQGRFQGEGGRESSANRGLKLAEGPLSEEAGLRSVGSDARCSPRIGGVGRFAFHYLWRRQHC
jgi:hypothetical protein